MTAAITLTLHITYGKAAVVTSGWKAHARSDALLAAVHLLRSQHRGDIAICEKIPTDDGGLEARSFYLFSAPQDAPHTPTLKKGHRHVHTLTWYVPRDATHFDVPNRHAMVEKELT